MNEIDYRPWGKYEVLLDSPDVKVKKITIDPNKRLSYQYHDNRREQWVVVKGNLTIILKKQSIRKNMLIFVNGHDIPKEELILISESWSETQEKFFRKMLKQGGSFTLNKVKYEIKLMKDLRTRSDGTRDTGILQIPGDTRF